MERDDDLEILFDEEMIDRRVREMGERISRDCAGKDLLLVGILKGAALFLADLARSITVPVEVAFIRASSYGNEIRSSGDVRITQEPDVDVAGRRVLLVDCIIDSGSTLAAVMERVRQLHPGSVQTAVLLDKRARRTKDMAIDYVGFEVPDRFLVGYGLDRAGQYRNLPYIAAIRNEDGDRP